MTTPAGPAIDVAQLEQALRATDPAVCLVPPRILRRAIKADRGLVGLGLRVPHVKPYVLAPVAPALLPRYFPGLEDRSAIDALLAEDVDAAAVLARTRPPGAPDPAAVCRPNGAPARPRDQADEAPPAAAPSEADHRRLVARAD